MRRSRNKVTRDAEYCDAGQDQKRHCAGYAAPQTTAREMTAHGLWPSDTFNRLTAASFLGSPRCRCPRPLPVRLIKVAAITPAPEIASTGGLRGGSRPCLN
jgi:ribonuclease I